MLIKQGEQMRDCVNVLEDRKGTREASDNQEKHHPSRMHTVPQTSTFTWSRKGMASLCQSV